MNLIECEIILRVKNMFFGHPVYCTYKLHRTKQKETKKQILPKFITAAMFSLELKN